MIVVSLTVAPVPSMPTAISEKMHTDENSSEQKKKPVISYPLHIFHLLSAVINSYV
jgi:hypothetical protein